MVMQVWIDESAQGNMAEPPWFAMAAVMAPAENWALLSVEWQALLCKHPVMDRFKFANFADKPSRRMEGKLLEFAHIVNRHATLAAGIVIDFPAYNRVVNTLTNYNPETKHPYFVASHLLVKKVTDALYGMGQEEPFEIFFDRQREHFRTFKKYYPGYLEMVQKDHPERAAIMPLEPFPRRSSEFMPLQAADLVVGMYRESAERPDERPFNWLHTEGFPHLRQAPGDVFIERDFIDAVSGPLQAAMQEAEERLEDQSD